MADLDIDDFIGHKTSSGGSSLLDFWKDRDPPQIDTWLHRRARITSVWRHSVPLVDNVKDFKTKEEVNKTTSSRLVCWEPENVLRAQYKRDNAGQRTTPPTVCGTCKFIDWIRLEVVGGRLDWLEPVFKLKGEADEKTTVVTATHIFNGFENKLDDYEDADRKRLIAAKVMLKDVWSLNYFAKANYIFTIVDNSHPEKGVQVTIEPALLGDKVKGVIGDMREKWGVDDGNPLKKPYCIRWKNMKEEKEFGKKYKAIVMDNIKLTETIDRLISDTDPPDTSMLTRRFNALTWKTKLQEQCLIDVPWDELFGDSAYGGEDQPGTDFDPAKLQQAPKPAPARPHEVQGASAPAAAEDEEVDCDECGKPIKLSDPKCPHCGHEYEVAAQPPPPPPPARKTRSQAKAEAAAPSAPAKAAPRPAPAQAPAKAAKPATASQRAKAPSAPIDTTGEAVADDDIPF